MECCGDRRGQSIRAGWARAPRRLADGPASLQWKPQLLIEMKSDSEDARNLKRSLNNTGTNH